jgi:CBS domain-containing protein
MIPTEHYQGPVATIGPDASACEVARAMKNEEVGSLVVVEADAPVGIVTDRDLLRRVIAVGRAADSTSARDIMSQPLLTASPEEPVERLALTMTTHHIRRVPVVKEGRLVGLVSLDDLLGLLADELGDLAEGTRRRFRAARQAARVRRVARDLEELSADLGGSLERLGGGTLQSLRRQFNSARQRIRRWKS